MGRRSPSALQLERDCGANPGDFECVNCAGTALVRARQSMWQCKRFECACPQVPKGTEKGKKFVVNLARHHSHELTKAYTRHALTEMPRPATTSTYHARSQVSGNSLAIVLLADALAMLVLAGQPPEA